MARKMEKSSYEHLVDIAKKLNLNPNGNDSVVKGRQIVTTRRGAKRISMGRPLADVHEQRHSETEALDESLASMSIREKLDYVLDTMAEIRRRDEILSRQLLYIYKEVQKTKVAQTCLDHQDMLDEVFKDISDERDIPDICDAPVQLRRSKRTLQHHGVTRMNINSKRFSCS